MPEKGLDMRRFTWEQGSRIGMTWVVAMFLKDFVEMCYNAGDGSEVEDVKHQGWTLAFKSDPSPRIQVRTTEPKTYGAVRDALLSLGYEVRDKKDHLVIIL